jgi:nucleoside-diphosphate-sugar epimerase
LENNKKTNTLIIGASSNLSKQYIEKYGAHKSNFFGLSSKVQGPIKNLNITIYEYKTAKKLKNIKFDEVLILASRLPSENIKLQAYFDTNETVLNILTNIVIPNCLNTKIIFISSYSVYSSVENFLDENSMTYKEDDYAYSKLNMENSLINLANSHNFNLMILRMPVLLYKGVNTNFLGKLLHAIKHDEIAKLSNPDASLSLVFDVDNIIKIVKSSWKGSHIVNCSSRADISFSDIAQIAKDYGLLNLEWVKSDRPSQSVSSSKLCSIIGEQPSAQVIVKNWFKEEFQK